MSDLTKITVIGAGRRVTLVIPADEPLGAHLPEIARLLEQPAARAALTTPYGEQLELALAPADQGVLDGAVLRLVDVAQLPAPPEVTDVTDRVLAAGEGLEGAAFNAARSAEVNRIQQEACAGDPALREEVASLVGGHDAADDGSPVGSALPATRTRPCRVWRRRSSPPSP